MQPHAVAITGPDRSERGYALIAAVAAIAVFATLALVVVMTTRTSIAAGSSEIARARAEAAADAGIAIATHGMIAGEDQYLELVRGRQHTIEFEGSQITIRIIDENSKIPLQHVETDALTRMLEQAGLSGNELAIASDSLADWLDGDDQPRANGAESAWYAPLGLAPRNGPPLTVDELARVRGFGPALISRLRPYVTVDDDVKSINPKYAGPEAMAVISVGGDLSPDFVEKQQEERNGTTALDGSRREDFFNRPMTLSIDANSPGGGHVHREAVIVLTGKPDRAYVIHAVR